MRDIRYLVRIQAIFVILFIFFKFIRPPVLRSGSPEFFKWMLLSLPNFFEAVIGTIVLVCLGLILNWKLNKSRLHEKWIYIAAVVLAGVYVITQELKIHNLGGDNVMDPNDLVYSVVGLCIGYAIMLILKPRIETEI